MAGMPYASIVGSLIYMILCTRPDIYFAIGMVSIYQSNPRSGHLTTIKYILKYLRMTKDYMLMYGGDELIPFGYNIIKLVEKRGPSIISARCSTIMKKNTAC